MGVCVHIVCRCMHMFAWVCVHEYMWVCVHDSVQEWVGGCGCMGVRVCK